MKKFLIASACAVILFASNGCRADLYEGSGRVVEREMNITSFSHIRADGVGDLILTEAGNRELKIETDDNLHSTIIARVSNDTLYLTRPRGVNPHYSELKYHLKAPHIRSIRINGTVSAVSTNTLTNDSLDIIISGQSHTSIEITASYVRQKIDGIGRIELAGTASEQVVLIDGIGKCLNMDLNTKKTDITIRSGSGKCETAVSEKLTIRVDGNGTIAYKGSPKIEKAITGNAEITQQRDK